MPMDLVTLGVSEVNASEQRGRETGTPVTAPAREEVIGCEVSYAACGGIKLNDTIGTD